MAKQNPATDPVSAAMSAIESALNLTEDDEAVTVESASSPQLVPAKATTATPVLKPSPLPPEASTLLRPGPQTAASAPESETKPAIPTSAPANDDREGVGAILLAMNARPASRTPFIIALIGSLLWAAVSAFYAYVALWPSAPARARRCAYCAVPALEPCWRDAPISRTKTCRPWRSACSDIA